MIKVRKPDAAKPPAFEAAAINELAAARLYYGRRRVANKAFIFKVYRHRDLRDSLNQIFSFKCAYCESYYGATHPVAIDHFRPKAMILEEGKRISPGYWWLAATWSNLFPTCIDCNSLRYVKGENGNLEPTGKGNQFPIANRARRAKREGDERYESPLLLNPSYGRVSPSNHLEFVFKTAYQPLLQPAIKNGKESKIGRESIRVYGLNRPQLVVARQYVAKRVAAQLRNLARTYSELRKNPGTQSQADFDLELQELQSLASATAPYSAMAKSLISKELGGWKGKTNALRRSLGLN